MSSVVTGSSLGSVSSDIIITRSSHGGGSVSSNITGSSHDSASVSITRSSLGSVSSAVTGSSIGSSLSDSGNWAVLHTSALQKCKGESEGKSFNSTT